MREYQKKNQKAKMIDEVYVQNARSIRAEFLRLNELLNKHEEELKKLSDIFLETSQELENYADGPIKEEKSVNDMSKFIMDKLNYLEVESNKLSQKIDPINEKIERLRRDENNLYELLIKKYSNMKEGDIVAEIQQRL